MKAIFKNPAPLLLLLSLILLLFILSLAAPAQQTRSAGAGTPITGWAWSDNKGWVSLHCQTGSPSGGNTCSSRDYGLGVSSGGAITGEAWGDNIGWIRPATGSECPGSGATVSGGNVTGWLRAINAGGDGCISLNGSGYGLGVSGGGITGYAWGDAATGWLSFNGSANLTPATCTMFFAGNPLWSSALPSSITIAYTAQNAVGNATVNPGGITTPSSGSSFSITPPNTTTTYQMSVTNSSGSTNANACQTTVTVNSGFPPPQGCISVNVNNPSCAAPIARTASIRKGTSALLYWSVSNVAAGAPCSLTLLPSGASAPGTPPTAGSNTAGYSTGALSTRTEYRLSCNALDGSVFVDRAVINIIPEFQEI